jgi:hypothetical protein
MSKKEMHVMNPARVIPAPLKPPRRKKKIPKAMREQIWLTHYGKAFEGKCQTSWCSNTINVWDFQAGHNIPESKGGKTAPENLVPICARCNLSMADNYTFQQWTTPSKAGGATPSTKDPTLAPIVSSSKWSCCFPFCNR